jgi:hypothetical protein
MGQGSGIGLCALALCAMYAFRCMLIVYSHPIPMGQGSVMGLWALSSVLHTLKIINGVLCFTWCSLVEVLYEILPFPVSTSVHLVLEFTWGSPFNPTSKAL